MPAPPTQKGQTRRFSRQLAQACRDRLPPEIIAEFWLTIVMGHGDAFIVEDDRCELGWRVDWDRDGRGSTSTNEEKARAMLTFQQAAFGTPAQSIQLQAHLTRSDDDTIALAPGQFSPAMLAGMERVMRELAAGQKTNPNAATIDAETQPETAIPIQPETAIANTDDDQDDQHGQVTMRPSGQR